jgi:hypothetical protein
VHRLEQRAAFLVLASTSPSEADGSMPSEPVSIAAISDHVAEQIVGYDDVELFWRFHQVHAAGSAS